MTDDETVTAALAGLPGAGPTRLGRLLDGCSASDAWARVREGRVASDVAPSTVRAEWKVCSQTLSLENLGRQLDALAVTATCWHDSGHPEQLTNDIDPAPIIFRAGELPPARTPHVAIVGTRRSSAIGREIAREFGRGLAEAGVVVVSGLALGVDGAAHHGALLIDGAPPLAVVGSGPDIVYPRANQDLWHAVAARGARLTEAPLGARADPWRFPARNRLIAALADLVVVVESRVAGGSLLTVEQATRRDIDVMAVPGSVRNAAAAGTNQLLADGCAPARDVDDVLVALGLGQAAATARRSAAPLREITKSTPDRSTGNPDRSTGKTDLVLEAVDDGPTSVDEIVDRIGIDVVEVYGRVAQLVADGHLIYDGAKVRRS